MMLFLFLENDTYLFFRKFFDLETRGAHKRHCANHGVNNGLLGGLNGGCEYIREAVVGVHVYLALFIFVDLARVCG